MFLEANVNFLIYILSVGMLYIIHIYEKRNKEADRRYQRGLKSSVKQSNLSFSLKVFNEIN